MAKTARIRDGLPVWWLILCLACCAPGAAGADGFPPADRGSWQLPHADLYGLDAVGSTVLAVGYWGTVLRSVDGGQVWSHQATPTDATLYAVSFGDERRAWAVGAAGTLLYSEDAGVSWKSVSVVLPADDLDEARPLDSPLFDVSAVSANEAWAVGDFGLVLHTRDGTQWEVVKIPQEAFADENIPDRILNGIEFLDHNNGWIVGEFGTTLRTVDGGVSWSGQRTFTGAVEDVYLMAVAVGGAGQAVAGGTGGVVIQTDDGGAEWSVAKLPTTAALFGAAWNGLGVLLVGDRGVVFFSRDDGKTWEAAARPRLFNWLRDVVLTPDGRAFAVGQNGLILRSSDAGQSWSQVAGAEPPPLDGISSPGGPSNPPKVEPTTKQPD